MCLFLISAAMNFYLLTTILSVSTLGYGQLIQKQRWGSRIKQSNNVGVIRGKNASIESFPFMASFTIEDEFLGSGVILNKHWILTTAFIVAWESLSEVKIRIGSDKYDSGGKVLKPKTLIVPSNYTGQWTWDIGLVQVEKPIKFGKTVKRIKLGSEELQNGTKVTIAGWGATTVDSYTASDTLKSAELTVLDRKTCSSTYASTSKLMCTFDKKSGPSTYDFGDPLIVKNAVYGLFAGADDLVPGEYPMVYTDVTKYLKWINEYIGG